MTIEIVEFFPLKMVDLSIAMLNYQRVDHRRKWSHSGVTIYRIYWWFGYVLWFFVGQQPMVWGLMSNPIIPQKYPKTTGPHYVSDPILNQEFWGNAYIMLGEWMLYGGSWRFMKEALNSESPSKWYRKTVLGCYTVGITLIFGTSGHPQLIKISHLQHQTTLIDISFLGLGCGLDLEFWPDLPSIIWYFPCATSSHS